MIIYFVNKYSNIKGPFGIIDAHHNRIIKEGDVCVKEEENILSLMLVVSSQNRWSACKCIGKTEGQLGLKGNVLVFSFDGLRKREGRLDVLNKLCMLFEDNLLKSFFLNAVDILSYKNDMWNASVISCLLECSCAETNMAKDTSIEYGPSNQQKFLAYLSDQSRILFFEMQSSGKSLREIYQIIRTNYSDDFRTSLKKFLSDHPNSTIYD